MESSFRGQSVFVTGGAGAFGLQFASYLREHSPSALTVFSRDEMKHAAAKRALPKCESWLKFRIGDICRADELNLCMRGADVVVHAAAMKHLGECEANPVASTRVNVAGTENVVNAFLQSSADTLIFLSTDKAPYASSVYGAQKYIGEKFVTDASLFSGDKKRAFSLRYSNVIDSTGAVFHIFGAQLKAGQKVTVNGSTTIRGFVTQRDVISTIETCLRTAKGGEVVVLVPKVIVISELAEAMCELMGRGEVEVKETTAFAGEKDSATLVMAEELGRAKEFSEAEVEAVLLDLADRHGGRKPAKLDAQSAFTLEHCPVLKGKELREFLRPVLKQHNYL